jgi:hypothetical protein
MVTIAAHVYKQVTMSALYMHGEVIDVARPGKRQRPDGSAPARRKIVFV